MDKRYMQIAIDCALKSIGDSEGGPFGAVVIRNGEVLGMGVNRVAIDLDPTAHAEINAIRSACARLKNFSLNGCEIYTTCEPCPMCLGSIYWARLDKIYYGAARDDAAEASFDDRIFYDEINKDPEYRSISMKQGMREECLALFGIWQKKPHKIHY